MRLLVDLRCGESDSPLERGEDAGEERFLVPIALDEAERGAALQALRAGGPLRDDV